MSPPAGVWPRCKKQACTDAGTAANQGYSPPTTFFFRSEREMQQQEDKQSSTPNQDKDFGVQSLHDTLEAAFEPAPSASPSSSSKKRRSGNPVHPKIAAAAQRIISERPSSRASSTSSPAPRPLTPSPTRRHVRTGSVTSLGRPFTPLRFNEHNLPSTPRSASVRSLRLSDEEGSIIDDSASQPVHSSSDDDEILVDDTLIPSAEPLNSLPQLVMPSISMPSRRPFTERGKRIPKFKIMIAGPSGVGKTSLIKSLVHVCEDIVHVDPISTILPTSTPRDKQISYEKTTQVSETNASTRSYPFWWSEVEQGRGLRRRKSMGESVLERNLCFVDTPGWKMSGASDQENMQDAIIPIVESIEDCMRQNILTADLNDTDLLNVFSGGGGFQVDAILYMFQPTSHHISSAEIGILRRLSALTNIIPIIGRADTCSEEHLRDAKTTIRTNLEAAGIRTFTFRAGETENISHLANDMSPFAISSALGEDMENMDASLLMSSGYMQPLVPSDLFHLVDQLFDPENIQWLRHCAVKQFLHWRRNHMGTSLELHKRELRELAIERLGHLHTEGLDVAPSSISSVLSSPSGIILPHLSGSKKRGPSPAPFRLVPAAELGSMSQFDFGRQIDIPTLDKASSELPSWARDLQFALDAEQEGKKQLTIGCKGYHDAESPELNHNHGQPTTRFNKASERYGLDPRDPLGLLAIGQRLHMNGLTMLRVAGGCGAIATIIVWTIRNWANVTEMLGFSTPAVQVPGYAVVSARESRNPIDFMRAVLSEWRW